MNRSLRLTLAALAAAAGLAGPAFAEGNCSYEHLTVATTSTPITTAQVPQTPAPTTQQR
jgi:hypothetical protein